MVPVAVIRSWLPAGSRTSLVDQVADAGRAVEAGRAERQAEALPFDVLELAREDVGDQGAADAARAVVRHHDVVAERLARGHGAVAVGVALDEGERAAAGEGAAVPVALEGHDGAVLGAGGVEMRGVRAGEQGDRSAEAVDSRLALPGRAAPGQGAGDLVAGEDGDGILAAPGDVDVLSARIGAERIGRDQNRGGPLQTVDPTDPVDVGRNEGQLAEVRARDCRPAA